MTPIEAANIEVILARIITIMYHIILQCMVQIKLNLINIKIPDVTKVAAWIKELTGVGPAIADGNHMWRPIWDDLPHNENNIK